MWCKKKAEAEIICCYSCIWCKKKAEAEILCCYSCCYYCSYMRDYDGNRKGASIHFDKKAIELQINVRMDFDSLENNLVGNRLLANVSITTSSQWGVVAEQNRLKIFDVLSMLPRLRSIEFHSAGHNSALIPAKALTGLLRGLPSLRKLLFHGCHLSTRQFCGREESTKEIDEFWKCLGQQIQLEHFEVILPRMGFTSLRLMLAA